MLAELLFERGRPGHELKAKAVVQHGEAAGGERDTLPVGAGDILAAAGAIECLAGVGREPFADRLQLATAERVNQPAIEGDTLAVPLSLKNAVANVLP